MCGLLILPSLLLSPGCASLHPAGKTVPAGSRVSVDYTCRLQDGRLAATTVASAAEESKNDPFTLFQPGRSLEPVKLSAGLDCPDCGGDGRSFEEILRENLAKQLAGAHYGQTLTLRIATDALIMDETEGLISIRRHQTRPKTKPVMLEMVTSYLGRKPEAGEIFEPTNGVDWPVKVVEVAETHVMIEQLPIEGKPWITPFGPASFMDDGEKFHLSIQPEMGHLVRSGGLIGRVVNIADEAITLDYRHPFGYEELTCKVTVLEAQPNAEDERTAAEAEMPEADGIAGK